MFTTFDQDCMQRALQLANTAQTVGEVPVGAVLVIDECIIAEGYNQSISQVDPTAHAEMTVLRLAANRINNYRLVNATLYTTLEPCCMCAGAMVHARIQRVVYATPDFRAGAGGTVFNLLQSKQLNHRCAVEHGLFADKSRFLLQQFFQARRCK